MKNNKVDFSLRYYFLVSDIKKPDELFTAFLSEKHFIYILFAKQAVSLIFKIIIKKIIKF